MSGQELGSEESCGYKPRTVELHEGGGGMIDGKQMSLCSRYLSLYSV
jgi:hypothetical protein